MQITMPGLYKSGKGKMIHFSSALGIGQGSMKQRVCVCRSKFYGMTYLRLYKRKHFLTTVF